MNELESVRCFLLALAMFFFVFFLFSVATNPVSGDSDFFANFDVVFCSDLFVRKSQGIS